VVVSNTLKIKSSFQKISNATGFNARRPLVSYQSNSTDFLIVWLHENTTSSDDQSSFVDRSWTRDVDEANAYYGDAEPESNAHEEREADTAPYELREGPQPFAYLGGEQWRKINIDTRAERDTRAGGIYPSSLFGIVYTTFNASNSYVLTPWDKLEFFLSFILPLMALPLLVLAFTVLVWLYKKYAHERVMNVVLDIGDKVQQYRDRRGDEDVTTADDI